MDGSANLARWSRLLLALAGILLVFTGLSFYLLPEYAAENFPWNVSPFVAMTIGGWTLGMGMMALQTIRGRSWQRFYTPALAVWAFCLFELVVLVAFGAILRTDHWLTWPYLASLLLGLASGILGLPVLWRMRSELLRAGDGVPWGLRLIYGGFVLLVFGLAVANLVRGAASGGNIFPEPLSAFTTQAFAAFFVALGVGALPLLVNRDVRPHVEYARTALYLIVLITVAAFVFLHKFDFAARPGGLIYLGAYLAAAAASIGLILWHRQPAAPEPRWRHG